MASSESLILVYIGVARLFRQFTGHRHERAPGSSAIERETLPAQFNDLVGVAGTLAARIADLKSMTRSSLSGNFAAKSSAAFSAAAASVIATAVL